MCEHLQPLENYLKEKGIAETFRGKAWSGNCREWVYYDCFLRAQFLKEKFRLPSFVMIHENTDMKSGTELGLVCTLCNDGIMGLHPNAYVGRKKQTIA